MSFEVTKCYIEDASEMRIFVNNEHIIQRRQNVQKTSFFGKKCTNAEKNYIQQNFKKLNI